MNIKKYLCVFLIVVGVMSARGQFMTEPRNVVNFEGELFGGITTPMGSFHGGEAETGGAMGLNLRCNISETPWDVGFTLFIGSAARVRTGDSLRCPRGL